MKILVTGHKGFIGSRLILELESQGYKWVGYDLEDGDDVRDKFKLYNVFAKEGIDIVINLAARAGVRTSELFADEYITTNVCGIRNLLELSEQFNVKHFISFSSSSVFGSQPSPNKETDALKPDSLYGITKATGEMMIEASGVSSTIVRPFTVYGENGRKDQVIFKWINQINEGKPISFFGDGETKRGYTYVGDLVAGVIKILDNEPTEVLCQKFNLGGNEIISLRMLLDIFREVKPDIKLKHHPLPKGDVAENWADISKAEKELGFKPNTNFVEKVREIISYELK